MSRADVLQKKQWEEKLAKADQSLQEARDAAVKIQIIAAQIISRNLKAAQIANDAKNNNPDN